MNLLAAEAEWLGQVCRVGAGEDRIGLCRLIKEHFQIQLLCEGGWKRPRQSDIDWMHSWLRTRAETNRPLLYGARVAQNIDQSPKWVADVEAPDSPWFILRAIFDDQSCRSDPL